MNDIDIKRARISPPSPEPAEVDEQSCNVSLSETQIDEGKSDDDSAEVAGLNEKTAGNTKPKRPNRRQKKKKIVKEPSQNESTALLRQLPFASEPSSSSIFSPGGKSKESATAKSPRQPRQFPNYFVGIPVLNPEIHSGIEEVQKEILTHDKRLKPALINVSTLHITLLVMKLDEVHCLHDARKALDATVARIREANLTELTLEFGGLENFRDTVLFVKVKENSELGKLHKIADYVRECFDENDICPTDEKGFQPHLTVAKMSKDFHMAKKVKKIKSECYEKFSTKQFGIENVKNIQVLSMLKKKDDVGYYHCPYQLALFDQPPDEEMCLTPDL